MAKKDQKDTPVATDPEIERVADALALPEPEDAAEVAPEPETKPALEPEIPKRKKAPKTSHKVTDWCGQLNYDGKKYRAGEGINLSAEEATALGKNVEPA